MEVLESKGYQREMFPFRELQTRYGRRTWVDKAVLKTPKEHLKASVDKASHNGTADLTPLGSHLWIN